MLARQSPSAFTTRFICVSCGGQMPLELVEPAINGNRIDNHVFRCTSCGLTETYSFARGQMHPRHGCSGGSF
jgi:hypothetical protein